MDGEVTVGRGPAADYFLDSAQHVRLISRLHASIMGQQLDNNHVRFILNNHGLNGTYLNDMKMGIQADTVRMLHVGDTVTFGHVQCGSIAVGGYAPQPNSEFQFVFEKAASDELAYQQTGQPCLDRIDRLSCPAICQPFAEPFASRCADSPESSSESSPGKDNVQLDVMAKPDRSPSSQSSSSSSLNADSSILGKRLCEVQEEEDIMGDSKTEKHPHANSSNRGHDYLEEHVESVSETSWKSQDKKSERDQGTCHSSSKLLESKNVENIVRCSGEDTKKIKRKRERDEKGEKSGEETILAEGSLSVLSMQSDVNGKDCEDKHEPIKSHIGDKESQATADEYPDDSSSMPRLVHCQDVSKMGRKRRLLRCHSCPSLYAPAYQERTLPILIPLRQHMPMLWAMRHQQLQQVVEAEIPSEPGQLPYAAMPMEFHSEEASVVNGAINFGPKIEIDVDEQLEVDVSQIKIEQNSGSEQDVSQADVGTECLIIEQADTLSEINTYSEMNKHIDSQGQTETASPTEIQTCSQLDFDEDVQVKIEPDCQILTENTNNQTDNGDIKMKKECQIKIVRISHIEIESFTEGPAKAKINEDTDIECHEVKAIKTDQPCFSQNFKVKPCSVRLEIMNFLINGNMTYNVSKLPEKGKKHKEKDESRGRKSQKKVKAKGRQKTAKIVGSCGPSPERPSSATYSCSSSKPGTLQHQELPKTKAKSGKLAHKLSKPKLISSDLNVCLPKTNESSQPNHPDPNDPFPPIPCSSLLSDDHSLPCPSSPPCPSPPQVTNMFQIKSPTKEQAGAPSQNTVVLFRQPCPTEPQESCTLNTQLETTHVRKEKKKKKKSKSVKDNLSESQKPIPTEPQKPLQSESQKPLPSELQKPLPSELQKPIKSESQEPLQSESQKPVKSESQKPLPSESNKPHSSGSQMPQPAKSKKSHSLKSQKLHPSDSQKLHPSDSQKLHPSELQKSHTSELQKSHVSESQKSHPSESQKPHPQSKWLHPPEPALKKQHSSGPKSKKHRPNASVEQPECPVPPVIKSQSESRSHPSNPLNPLPQEKLKDAPQIHTNSTSLLEPIFKKPFPAAIKPTQTSAIPLETKFKGDTPKEDIKPSGLNAPGLSHSFSILTDLPAKEKGDLSPPGQLCKSESQRPTSKDISSLNPCVLSNSQHKRSSKLDKSETKSKDPLFSVSSNEHQHVPSHKSKKKRSSSTSDKESSLLTDGKCGQISATSQNIEETGPIETPSSFSKTFHLSSKSSHSLTKSHSSKKSHISSDSHSPSVPPADAGREKEEKQAHVTQKPRERDEGMEGGKNQASLDCKKTWSHQTPDRSSSLASYKIPKGRGTEAKVERLSRNVLAKVEATPNPKAFGQDKTHKLKGSSHVRKTKAYSSSNSNPARNGAGDKVNSSAFKHAQDKTSDTCTALPPNLPTCKCRADAGSLEKYKPHQPSSSSSKSKTATESLSSVSSMNGPVKNVTADSNPLDSKLWSHSALSSSRGSHHKNPTSGSKLEKDAFDAHPHQAESKTPSSKPKHHPPTMLSKQQPPTSSSLKLPPPNPPLHSSSSSSSKTTPLTSSSKPSAVLSSKPTLLTSSSSSSSKPPSQSSLKPLPPPPLPPPSLISPFSPSSSLSKPSPSTLSLSDNSRKRPLDTSRRSSSEFQKTLCKEHNMHISQTASTFKDKSCKIPKSIKQGLDNSQPEASQRLKKPADISRLKEIIKFGLESVSVSKSGSSKTTYECPQSQNEAKTRPTEKLTDIKSYASGKRKNEEKNQCKKQASNSNVDCRNVTDEAWGKRKRGGKDESDSWDLPDGVQYYDNLCYSSRCKNPCGKKVDWVMCDICEQWYHVACVNIDAESLHNENADYFCDLCEGNKPSKRRKT